MAHLYVLLLVIVSWTWVTTGSVSIPAGSAQKDCVAPRLLGQSTRFPFLAVGERFDGFCNFTNYENRTVIKFEHRPGNPNYNTSVVNMLSTVLAQISIENVEFTSEGLYSATACNSLCCTVCYISLSVEGACQNRQTPIPIVNYTELNVPINETVTTGCAFYGDPDQSNFDISWGYGSKTEIVNHDSDNKYSKQRKRYSNCSFASFLTIMRVTEKDSGNYSCQSKSYSQPAQYGTKADTILGLVQRPVVTNSPDEIVEEDLFNPTVLEYFVENFSWFIAFSIKIPSGTEPDVTIEPLFSLNWDKIRVRFTAKEHGHYMLCMAYKMNVTTEDHITFNCSKTTDLKRGMKWIGVLAAIILSALVMFIIIATIIAVCIVYYWRKKRRIELSYELVRQDGGLEVEGNNKSGTHSVGSARRGSNSDMSRDIFTRLSADIYELMDPVSILQHLRTNGLVKDWQYQELTLPTTTPHRRKELLMGWLPDSSPNFLELFVESLDKAQEHEPHSELSAMIKQEMNDGLTRVL